ncbi:hypothetical protein PIB30_069858, partial [Stylosanthes scabra]|nr:hypothetical protein [Stylosanthes scabra]
MIIRTRHQFPNITTLQLCTDGYYRQPRSTECTDGSAVGISIEPSVKLWLNLRENCRRVPTAQPSVIYKIISRQTAARRLNNTDGSAVDVAAVVRSGDVVAFSDGLAVGNDSDGLAV